jgi:hypothetical protein
MVLGHRPDESLLQEWLMGQVGTDPALFAAKHLDASMINPNSEQLVNFL